MTLDKDDLLAIQGVVEPLIRTTVEPLIKSTVEPLITAAVEPLISRMDSFEQRLSALEDKVDSVASSQSDTNKRLDALEDTVKSVHESQIAVETVQYPRIAAALDGSFVNRDKLEEHDGRISFLERKADIHDTRLFGLEQEKQKA
jgi:predicted nuclease with TOPRIM domain